MQPTAALFRWIFQRHDHLRCVVDNFNAERFTVVRYPHLEIAARMKYCIGGKLAREQFRDFGIRTRIVRETAHERPYGSNAFRLQIEIASSLRTGPHDATSTRDESPENAPRRVLDDRRRPAIVLLDTSQWLDDGTAIEEQKR